MQIFKTLRTILHKLIGTFKQGTPKTSVIEVSNAKRGRVPVYAVANNALISPPVLALPNSTGHIDTDACDVPTGCKLLQEKPQKTVMPIGYWSTSHTDAERLYETTEQKCLAIVCAALFLCPYLEHTRFTLKTDHNSLKGILNLMDSSERIACRCLRLLEYEFDVVHRAGIKREALAGISRLPTTGEDRTPLKDDLHMLAVYITESRESIRMNDSNCNEVFSLKTQAPLTDNMPPSEE